MSSGVPIRFTGSRAASRSMNALFIAPASSSISGVSMNPGAIVLTRIGASSIASDRAHASMAPQDAAPTAEPPVGFHADVPDMNVIEPPFIRSAPYFAAYNDPQKRVSIEGRGAELSFARFKPKVTDAAVMNK